MNPIVMTVLLGCALAVVVCLMWLTETKVDDVLERTMYRIACYLAFFILGRSIILLWG